VFLLAAGGSALNQVQERATDALMARTRHRPLPAGLLSPRAGLAVVLALFASALALLLAAGPLPAGLGVFAIVWYNGVYTPLKKITPWALLPGALCGALPPVLGWTAAGGAVADYRIILLAGIFFLWQVPHFWLLARRCRRDYRRAGLPTVARLFPPRQARRITLAWVIALAAATSLFLAIGPLRQDAARILCAASGGWALLCAASGRRRKGASDWELLLGRPEPFMALFVTALLLDGLLSAGAPSLLAMLRSIQIG
jgi:protoheme IX farnesyltransferase